MAPAVLESLFEGPYGFDALLTARTTFLKIEATLSTGEKVVVWPSPPALSVSGGGRP